MTNSRNMRSSNRSSENLSTEERSAIHTLTNGMMSVLSEKNAPLAIVPPSIPAPAPAIIPIHTPVAIVACPVSTSTVAQDPPPVIQIPIIDPAVAAARARIARAAVGYHIAPVTNNSPALPAPVVNNPTVPVVNNLPATPSIIPVQPAIPVQPVVPPVDDCPLELIIQLELKEKRHSIQAHV